LGSAAPGRAGTVAPVGFAAGFVTWAGLDGLEVAEGVTGALRGVPAVTFAAAAADLPAGFTGAPA